MSLDMCDDLFLSYWDWRILSDIHLVGGSGLASGWILLIEFTIFIYSLFILQG
jgi:hypothetical protein